MDAQRSTPPSPSARPVAVRIDRLSLRLPAGFGDQAPAIARLTAAGLAATLRERAPSPGWRPEPVHVIAERGEPAVAVADRTVANLTKGWR